MIILQIIFTAVGMTVMVYCTLGMYRTAVLGKMQKSWILACKDLEGKARSDMHAFILANLDMFFIRTAKVWEPLYLYQEWYEEALWKATHPDIISHEE